MLHIYYVYLQQLQRVSTGLTVDNVYSESLTNWLEKLVSCTYTNEWWNTFVLLLHFETRWIVWKLTTIIENCGVRQQTL